MLLTSHADTLKKHGLKDTLPRRVVMEVLASSKKPLSPMEIQKKAGKGDRELGIVTVYRVLEALEKAALLHRHPFDGLFSLCTLTDVPGHHILLHCHDCGRVQEVHDKRRREERLARKQGFFTSSHVSEMSGTCHSCS
jgi:Fe2+ or Zn2+ uptake regulation protein